MQNRTIQQCLSRNDPTTSIIGKSEGIIRVKLMIDLFGPTGVTVLIIGESGTGKELVAGALHARSAHFKGPFLAVNCAAIPEGLFESEILGHERGAFTGAVRDKQGIFERAKGGTVFLDEIGDMPLLAQAKLLRVLQEREVQRVGGEKMIKIDCRVIAATNKDLRQAVRKGAFREDLFYRLNVEPITVPPLRERVEDIPLLVNHFIGKHLPSSAMEKGRSPGISREALDALMSYSFPGNIRELQNCMERAVILACGGEINPEHLPGHIIGNSPSDRAPSSSKVNTDELHAAMAAVTLSGKGGSEHGWGEIIKAASVKDIHRFLVRTNGDEFTRKEFENFLSTLGGNDKSTSRYATAGRYIKVLREKGILEQNAAKANRVRFRLSNDFIKES